MSVLTLPVTAIRISGKIVRKLTPLALIGTAAAVIRTVRPPSAPPARVTRDPGPGAAPTRAPKLVVAEPPAPFVAPAGPELVIDPIPLAEPALDLDVEVTLPSELPIRAYDALAAKDAVNAIRDLTDVEEVRTVLAFEEENAKRSTVLAAARGRLAVLETGAAAAMTPGSGA